MNRSVATILLSAMALGTVPAAVMTGCEPSRKSAATTGTMTARQFKTQLDRLPTQIDGIMDTIIKLQDVRATDLSALTQQFMTQSQDLATQASRIRIEADAMRRDAGTYFEAWNREVMNSSGGTKEQAAAARAKDARWFATLQDYLNRGGNSYGQFSSSLNTIRDGLAKSPTRATIESLRGTFDTAVKQGTDARNIATALSAEITKTLGV